MAASTLFYILILSALYALSCAFSTLRTCTDGNCARSSQTTDMLSDYGNTTCKPVNVAVGGSFQITELDPGCSVTLYASRTVETMCSGGTTATGRVQTCYSSSWTYYSIDGCRSPTSPATVPFSKTVASTISPASRSKDGKQEPRRNGIVAGTIVAGVAAIALVFAGVWQFRRRRPKVKPADPHELSTDQALVETVSVEKQVASELEGDHAAVEIGRNSQFESQAEASTQKPEVKEEQDEDELYPIIRIHWVV